MTEIISPRVKTRSIVISDPMNRFVESRYKSDDDSKLKWSQAINEGFKQLNWLARKLLPEFTQAEWEILLNAYAATIPMDLRCDFRIASDLMDNAGTYTVEDLTPEYRALVEKCSKLSQPEQWAVCDAITRFWASDWSKAESFTQIIKELKAGCWHDAHLS